MLKAEKRVVNNWLSSSEWKELKCPYCGFDKKENVLRKLRTVKGIGELIEVRYIWAKCRRCKKLYRYGDIEHAPPNARYTKQLYMLAIILSRTYTLEEASWHLRRKTGHYLAATTLQDWWTRYTEDNRERIEGHLRIYPGLSRRKSKGLVVRASGGSGSCGCGSSAGAIG